MSFKDSEEYMSSSHCDSTFDSIILGQYTAITASILLNTSKIFSKVGDYHRASSLLQKLFAQDYSQNATAGTLFSGAILTWGVLRMIGGRDNIALAAKTIRWVADNTATTFLHELKIHYKEFVRLEAINASPPATIRYSNTFLQSTPPNFPPLHDLSPSEAPRALRVLCLLVHSQQMIHLDRRPAGMVTLLDCFSYQSRGEGWVPGLVYETPVEWFNDFRTWSHAARTALDILGEDGVLLSLFCLEQAVLRGDGTLPTLMNLAVLQYKTGDVDDAVFTLSNLLNEEPYNYKIRNLVGAWSTPYRLRFDKETQAAGFIIRFFMVMMAKIRIKNLKKAAEEQLWKDEQNARKLVEFWRYKDEAWGKKCFRKWVEYWHAEMIEKNKAAAVLQNRCRGVNAKNELERRKTDKNRVEGLIATSLAKLLQNAQGRYMIIWKMYVQMCRQNKAGNKIQDFGRIVLAKRKVRQEKIIARALGKSTDLMVRNCYRAWSRWVLDLKLNTCASRIQRRWRGLAGRRDFLKEERKMKRQEELIAMALGKNTERIIQRVFSRMRDDYIQNKMNKAAVKLQTRARGLLGRNALERRKVLERNVKEMAFLVAGKNVERLQRKFICLLFHGLQDKAALKFQCIFRRKRGRDELAIRRERKRRVKALCRR